jgi:F-type H+-transporting ATPase subunit b
MLDINPGLILWTILTFLIVLVILRAAAWKPLLAALNAREESIRTALRQAEEARAQAQALLDENRKQREQAEAQSQRLISEGRDMGERLKAEIVDKASSSSRHMIEQAKEEIRREKEASLVRLREEMSDLAIAVAGKLLDANLDDAKQRSMADAAIREISKAPAR